MLACSLRVAFCRVKRSCVRSKGFVVLSSAIDAFVEEGDIGNHLSDPNATTTTEPKPRGVADAQIANFRERISKSCSGALDSDLDRRAPNGGTMESRWRRAWESKVNGINNY